jgi:hypothetical protein
MADASQSERNERSFNKLFQNPAQAEALIIVAGDAVKGSAPSMVSSMLLATLLPDLAQFPADEDADADSSSEVKIKARYTKFKALGDAASAQVMVFAKFHVSQGYVHETLTSERAAKIEDRCDVHAGLADWLRVEAVDPSVRVLRQLAFQAGQAMYLESEFRKLRKESLLELKTTSAAPTPVEAAPRKMIQIPYRTTKFQMKNYLSIMLKTPLINLDYAALHDALRNQPSMANEFNMFRREREEADTNAGKPDLPQSTYVLEFLVQQEGRLSSLSLHDSAMTKVLELKQERDETSSSFLIRANSAIASAYSLGSEAGHVDSRLKSEEERCRLVVAAMNEKLRKEVRMYINTMKQKQGGDSRFGQNSFLEWNEMQNQVTALATAAELDNLQDIDDVIETTTAKPRGASSTGRRPEARSVEPRNVPREPRADSRDTRGGERGGGRGGDRGGGRGGYRGGDRRDEGHEQGRRDDSRDRGPRDGSREEPRKFYCYNIPRQQGFEKGDGLCMPPKDHWGNNQCMYHFHGKACAFGKQCKYSHHLKLVDGEVLTARTIKRRVYRDELANGRKNGSEAGSSASGSFERARYHKEQAKSAELAKENKELKRAVAKAKEDHGRDGGAFRGEGNHRRDDDAQHDDDGFSGIDEGGESSN